MAWGNPQQLALEQKICDMFNDEHPSIHVDLVRVPGSAYSNKMIIMLASHTAPDVMRCDHYFFPSLVKKDYFLCLEPLIAKERKFYLDDYFPIALDECKYQGKVYALNVLFGSVMMYYNKTLVKKAGLEDPFELWKKGEWTWDRFVAHAKAMTKRRPDGRFESFGAAMPEFPQYFASLYSFGGKVMDKDWKTVTAGSGKAAEAWQFWYDLRYKQHYLPSPGEGANAVFNFESGKLGMVFDWMGMTPRYAGAIKDFEWDICPIPAGPAGSTSIVKGNQLVINRESEHPAESWEFVKHITGDKVERMLARMRRCCPARMSVAYSDDFLKGPNPPFNTRTFTYAVESAKPLPITSRWNEWTREFRSGIENLLGGIEHDARVSAKEAEDRANKTLAVREGL
jgi:multiple sugar transport system substrate-binding protein